MKAQITLTIPHVRRLNCTQKCVQAIFDTVNIPFKIVLLVQGKQTEEAYEYFRRLEKLENVDIHYFAKQIEPPIMVRNISIDLASSPLIMTLDNDCYLQSGWLEPVLEITKDPKIITISIPLYDKKGNLQGLGKVVSVKNRVFFEEPPKITEEDWKRGYVKVDTQPEGCMIFRASVKHLVKRDLVYWVGFSGLDMNFKLNKFANRKGLIRVVSLKSKAKHYQITPDLTYKKLRVNYAELFKGYKLFQKRWGVRLPMQKHLMYRHLFAVLARLPVAIVDAIRQVRRKRPLIWIWKPKVM